MNITHSTTQFTFLNAHHTLTASVKQVLEHIAGCLPGADPKDDAFFKIKSIVTELLTNAFKHAGTESVTITIEIDENYIKIQKTDNGKPFKPIPGTFVENQKKMLAYDVMHTLHAVSEPGNCIRFIVEESFNDNPDINEVTEHFGLLIITKCAAEFIYCFDEGTAQNHFIVKLLLPK